MRGDQKIYIGEKKEIQMGGKWETGKARKNCWFNRFDQNAAECVN